jgi:hypothetical protein
VRPADIPAHPLPERSAGLHIQRGGGLVEDQQRGVAGQGQRQPHALALAARQPLDAPPGDVLEVGQPQHLGQRERLGVQAADQADELGHPGPLGQAGVLQHGPDPAGRNRVGRGAAE